MVTLEKWLVTNSKNKFKSWTKILFFRSSFWLWMSCKAHIIWWSLRSFKVLYTEIDDVMKQCIEQKQVDLFLIALGPTGTVLAARLHHRGFRALDIGHLNNSYDTVFLNQMRPEQITYLASDSIPK